MDNKKNTHLHIRCSNDTKLKLAELAKIDKRTSADFLRLLLEKEYEKINKVKDK